MGLISHLLNYIVLSRCTLKHVIQVPSCEYYQNRWFQVEKVIMLVQLSLNDEGFSII